MKLAASALPRARTPAKAANSVAGFGFVAFLLGDSMLFAGLLAALVMLPLLYWELA